MSLGMRLSSFRSSHLTWRNRGRPKPDRRPLLHGARLRLRRGPQALLLPRRLTHAPPLRPGPHLRRRAQARAIGRHVGCCAGNARLLAKQTPDRDISSPWGMQLRVPGNLGSDDIRNRRRSTVSCISTFLPSGSGWTRTHVVTHLVSCCASSSDSSDAVSCPEASRASAVPPARPKSSWPFPARAGASVRVAVHAAWRSRQPT